jgi:hypothetical protein
MIATNYIAAFVAQKHATVGRAYCCELIGCWCRTCQVSFGNGRIEEFYVACNCLSAEQMAEADVARALAAAMASFHFESLLHLPPQEATEPQVCTRA